MSKYSKLFFILALMSLISACSYDSSKIIVAKYDDSQINLKEFEQAYVKNTGNLESAKKDTITALQNFLDLYVNYKMKLKDAEVRGYKSDPTLQREITDYKVAIGQTIYLEKALFDPWLKNLYERRKKEFRVSHIFLTPDSSHNEEQTIALAKEIIQKIKNGEDFGKLAAEYSKDNYTKGRGGDVYYVVSGNIVSPSLDDAVYSISKPGEIYSEPVKSSFGYHIIKVTDIVNRKPYVKALHILAAFKDSTGTTDSVKALAKINDIEARLKAGEDFKELAKKYSDDPGSGKRGGDLGKFERGKMVMEFDEAAFKLNKDEVSSIIKTQFGYHIIKVYEIGKLPTFEEDKENLKDLFQRTRYKNEYDKLVDTLKVKYAFKLNEESFKNIIDFSDTTKLTVDFKEMEISKKFGNNELFVIKNDHYSVDSLLAYMTRQKNMLLKPVSKGLISDALYFYSTSLALRYKSLEFDKENKDFAGLMDDYESGVYLFKLLEDEVWNKIEIDSASLYNYWSGTKDKYNFGDRVKYNLIYSKSDSTVYNFFNLLKSGSNFDSLMIKNIDKRELGNRVNEKDFVDIELDELSKAANKLANVGDYSSPVKYKEGWAIVKLIAKDGTREKSFEEAKAEASSLFQESESKRLENEFINKLKEKYKPVLNYEELERAFK
ncbi:MAG: peptidylprolyl isomerase [Melioribacteraceae bacterium]